MDTDNTIIGISRSVESYFDVKSSDLIGMKVMDFLTDIKDYFANPDEYLLHAQRNSYEKHEDGSLNIMEMSKSAVTLKGADEKKIILLPKDIFDEEGTLLGKLLTFADVTEHTKDTSLIKTLVDASPIPTIVSRLDDGTVIYANEPLANLFGMTPEEARGKKTPDFYYHPEERDEVIGILLKDGSLKNHEVQLKGPDGKPIWMIFNFSVTKLGKEEVTIGTFYDISERKEAENELRESEKRFRQLAENIGELFWMTTPDKKELIYVSPMYEEIFGRKIDDVRKNPESWLEFIHPEDRDRIIGKLALQIKGKYAEEYRIVRPDGSIRWLWENAYPIRHSDGETYRLCGVIEDITERKTHESIIATRLRYEEGLAECSQILLSMAPADETIIPALHHLVMASGLSGVFIFENTEHAEMGLSAFLRWGVDADGSEMITEGIPEEVFSYEDTFGAWRDKLMQDQPYGGPRSSLDPACQEMMQEQGSLSFLILPIWVNNDWWGFIGFDNNEEEREWTDEEVRLLRTTSGMIGGYLARNKALEALHDSLFKLEATNQNLLETQTQLVQSEKMASLGMLVAGIAHEINTPIGAVSSMHNTSSRAMAKLQSTLTTSCNAECLQDEKVQQLISMIEEANGVIDSGIERVTTIVRRLRSFARLDEAELKEVDIHDGLEDTLELIHHEIKHHIEIIRNYGELPRISCYPGRLNQVFLNILINAKQAITNKGTITITTRSDDDFVYIIFKDDGVGIPQEKLGKVFDPGFTTKGVGIGTGLGLSICYQIISDHEGEIKVESEVGSGTTFTIILPIKMPK